MQVLASHQVGRALPAGADKAYAAELHRQDQLADATAKIVELSVFKRGAPASDRDLPAVPEDRGALSMDMATSLLEELQQARFREARRLKRVETLEREVTVARAQNEALRMALESAREEAGVVATTGGAVVARLDPDAGRARKTAGGRKLGRSLMRLFRSRH
ncbi:hypothetical protein [Methylobacterium haplocladii]|uniref:Uncharacterized protein n=1 Tax=Methylobacterium haplocladii TaxID=1176176 RepID=A0A512IQJ5_9HYPH|nr:hypothetical protein [Methylobacterium haplocladii]GEO99945.1 hypothetical protein MHA02_23330 [Methylobacterium haplocladii]GJD86214.1 hypothetical protein HPGCJGGD_4113 [Methylobacterium haplocladii]GLS59659.1 hypothetical protein GCM10007887_23280 [Methylobacterium haplocladii]